MLHQGILKIFWFSKVGSKDEITIWLDKRIVFKCFVVLLVITALWVQKKNELLVFVLFTTISLHVLGDQT